MTIGAVLGIVSLAVASNPIISSVESALYKPAMPAKASTGITLPMGRCLNLGGELETGGWPTQETPSVSRFTAIKAAGFKTIRLPIKWDTHAQPLPDYQIDPRWFALIDAYVSTASEAGLNVIINIHHFRDLDANPDGNVDRFVAFWDQIAAHFAKAPSTVWFELLNEPHDKVTEPFLRGLYARALAKIRLTNPTRPVIAGGANGSNSYTLSEVQLPDDPYIVPEFHSYAPLAFTHQGAYWVKPAFPVGVGFPATMALQTQMQQVGLVKDYMQRTGRVPVMLEFGAIGLAAEQDRVRYYHAMSSAMASLGVYSCVWNDKVFPLLNNGVWDRDLLASIASPIEAQPKKVRRKRVGKP
jgi:endoglucanase